MRAIDADKLLEEWDERTDDHRITDSEFHRMINEDLPIIEFDWHYPSKGEYPDEDGEYLFLVRAFSSIHRVVGDYEVSNNQRLWYAEIADHCIEDEPIAWMPLPDLPKDII